MNKLICVSFFALFAMGCIATQEEAESIAMAEEPLSSLPPASQPVLLLDGETIRTDDTSACSLGADGSVKADPSPASCSGSCSFCINDALSCWNILKKAKISGYLSWNESNSTCYCVGNRDGCCP